MVRGLTSSASGMIAQMAGQDITANNLANVNTSGYKRDIPSFQAMLTSAVGAAPTVHVTAGGGVDFSQGALQTTGSKLNFALEGDGFFTVQTANGPAYTRDGAFTVKTDGSLVTLSGDSVLGAAGPIKIGKGEIAVDPSGTVSQNGVAVDTLKIARFANQNGLTKLGGNLWSAGGQAPVAATGTSVRQGYLESSNVNSVSEMVTMISDYRTFEASSKAVQAADSTLDKCVNEVGRVG